MEPTDPRYDPDAPAEGFFFHEAIMSDDGRVLFVWTNEAGDILQTEQIDDPQFFSSGDNLPPSLSSGDTKGAAPADALDFLFVPPDSSLEFVEEVDLGNGFLDQDSDLLIA